MNFNGYSMFNDVMNPVLRPYNRVNTFLNIRERHGSDVARSYLKKFDRNGQVEIFNMMSRIQKSGFEQTRRDIMRANNA